MMKLLFAPDSFKGTLSSLRIIELLEKAAKQHFDAVEILKLPIADGGEGTVESLLTAKGGQYRKVQVCGPMPGQKVNALYGQIGSNTAVIEMAQASGLTLVSQEERNPLVASTYGTGELIRHALEEGLREFIIGIGGSATNDGGIGALQALGIRFLDEHGNEAGQGGQVLDKIRSIDTEGLDPRIHESQITVICDVSNPLTGPKGATAVFGPQKGVTEETFDVYETGMKRYEALIRETTGMDMVSIPGTGAAGGLGAALVAFLEAQLKPGIETILDFVGFEQMLKGVDLVITGEGRIDGQSIYGKVPVGIARRCGKKGIPVLALVGGMGSEAEKVYDCGIGSIMSTVNGPMTLKDAMDRAEPLLLDAADRMFRILKIGMGLSSR